MRLLNFELKLAGALMLVVVSAAVGLTYNAFGGIPLIAVGKSSVLVQGVGLPDEDGTHLVGLDAARTFYLERRGTVIDARTPELYRQGHIPGAVNCYVYELETYLPPLLEKLALDGLLMIYCAGEDCEDSRFLAQTLQELGFRRIYVFEGGFSGWQGAGMEVDSGDADGSGAEAGVTVKHAVDFGRYVPGWLWLAGEMALLAFGLYVLGLLLSGRQASAAYGPAMRLVGAVFLLASLHKISSPHQFAAVVDNYQILPSWMVNTPAVILPWVELICGALLLSGRCRGQSALVLAGLTLIFILAISFNIARGVEFDCGCFGSGHTPPWRVLLRDVGLLLCCLPALVDPARQPAQNRT